MHDPRIEKLKIRPVHGCASNFCQNLGEASELTTHEQRGASALGACSAHADRIQSAHVKKPKQRPAIDRQRNLRKGMLTPTWLSATDPSNSDNLSGDGGG